MFLRLSGKPTICLLDGNVEIARLKVAGAVRAMSLWHWKESIVLLGARIVAMVLWLSSVELFVFVDIEVAFRESLRDVQFSNDVSLRLRHRMQLDRTGRAHMRKMGRIVGSVLGNMSRYL
jgi:hypothetical protein